MTTHDQALWTSRGFLWLGLACAAAGLAWTARRVIALQLWSVAPGQVVTSKVNRAESGEGEGFVYSATVTVRWKVTGEDVERAFNQWGTSSNESRYQAIVARHAVGSSTPVCYDPSRPNSAYIEAGYTFAFFLFPLLVTAGGSAFALLGYYVGRWTKVW